MTFIRVTGTDELLEGQMKSFPVNGTKVLLVKTNGSIYAVDNKCPHIGKPLDRGKLDGCVLECAFHHARFDLRTGNNVGDAKIFFLKMRCKPAKTYAVKVEGNDILVEQQ